MYWFPSIFLYFVYYEDLTDEDSNDEDLTDEDLTTQRPANRPILPQTGLSLMNTSLIGAGILAVSGVAIHLKNKNRD